MTTDDTYSVDLDNMTVLRSTAAGEVINLDSSGCGCETIDELVEFINELHSVEFISETVRNELLSELTDCIDAAQMAAMTIEDLMAALVQS